MIMDQSEIDKLNIMTTQFNLPQLTFRRSDIGAGQDVTITVRNTFGDEAICTLYYQVEGKTFVEPFSIVFKHFAENSMKGICTEAASLTLPLDVSKFNSTPENFSEMSKL